MAREQHNMQHLGHFSSFSKLAFNVNASRMHSKLIPLQKQRNGMETITVTHATTFIIALRPRQHFVIILPIRDTAIAMVCCRPLAIRWIMKGIHPHHSRSLESSCQSLMTFKTPYSSLHHKKIKKIQIAGH